MKGALRGGLSAAMTGEAFWSHDMGGFVGQKPSNELYIRWAQFGLLSPVSRFHGTTPREPWHYSSEAVEVVRRYAGLRYALIPYLLAAAQESVETGLPILRPMALEFPDEPLVDQLDDQYLLGPDLLVAPVFKEGARSRFVYFPKGRWWPFEKPGRVIVGPGFHKVAALLARIPLFARPGAVIPRYVQAPPHLKDPAPHEWLLDIYPGEAERRLRIPETGFTAEIAYRFQAGAGRLHVTPAPVNLTIRLMHRQPETIQVNGADATWQASDGYVYLMLNADRGVELTYRISVSR
jgi:alpha-D-xyloside xylohydrolase